MFLEAEMEKNIILHNNQFILKDKILKNYLNLKKIYDSQEFLLLILQRSDRVFWRKKLKDDFSSNVISYFSFVQKEIKNNWFLLSENFENIATPTFLTFESSQTLMVKLIEFFKEKENLSHINLSSEELAQKMLSNLYSLSTGNNSYSNFSKLIKKQKFFSQLPDETYENLNKLLEVYLSRTLKLGVFDYPATLYIFNNYLLENGTYIKSLERYKAVLVDDYQSQIPCINKFLEKLKNFTAYENISGAYGIYYPNSKKKSISLDHAKQISDKSPSDFLDKLHSNLFYEKQNSLNIEKIKIKKTFENKVDLYDYLFKLIKKAKENNFENILVLSPSRNINLIDSMEKFSQKENMPFLNLDKNEKILDNPLIYAFSSLGIIYFNYGKLYLNEDEIRQILVLLFRFNIFQASEVAKRVSVDNNFLAKVDKYKISDLKLFFDIFKESYQTVTDFYKAFLDKKDFFDDKTVEALEKIYDFSKLFIDNINHFDNIKDKNLEFFITLRKGVKESESLDEISKKNSFTGLSLGTPASFLKLSKKVQITIFIDLDNNLWNINFVNFLQNPFLLNGTFDNKEYDYENDSYLKREELFNLISLVYMATEKNILFLGTKNNENSLMYKILKE